MAQRPVAIGIVLCEQVVVENRTHNLTPVNCFNERQVKSVPTDKLSFVALAFLTDGLGEVEIKFSILRLDTLEVFLERTFKVEFKDPIKEIPFQFRVNKSFPHEGVYEALLSVDNETLVQKRFHIRLVESKHE